MINGRRDRALNDFVLICNRCWRTNKDKHTKIIRTSRDIVREEMFPTLIG